MSTALTNKQWREIVHAPTILTKNLETLMYAFPLPQCLFVYYSGLSASKYAWLNIEKGEGTSLQWEQKCKE